MRRLSLSTEWNRRSGALGFQSAAGTAGLTAGNWVGIAVSRTNDFVTEKMLDGAVAEFGRHGIEDVVVMDVAGAFELVAASRALLNFGAAGVVALGAVIRGETPHFDFIAQGVTSGLAAIAADGQPVTFGVLTVDSAEQAAERAGGSLGNKGAEAAAALVQLLSAIERLDALILRRAGPPKA